MSLFSKKNSPKYLENMMHEYKEVLNEKYYPLSYVFKFHENNGVDYIYRENTDKRNVFLLRNKNRIALKQIDETGKEIFYAEKEISIYTTSQLKIVKIIHDLYIEEFT